MSDKTDGLAAALAAVQTRLPVVGKTETANVKTRDGGSYKYSYADLADVSKAILPLLGAAGLSWVTKPTFNEAGKFVLVYKLLHISGEFEAGEYPLPSSGTAQEIGSAITYARRYTLCAVTGVAPESDDDDGAAASTRREQWDEARPAESTPTRDAELAKATAAISRAASDAQLDAISDVIDQRYAGGVFDEEDTVRLRSMVDHRREQLQPEAA